MIIKLILLLIAIISLAFAFAFHQDNSRIWATNYELSAENIVLKEDNTQLEALVAAQEGRIKDLR